MMPTTNMSSPPGMHMPIMPAIAPIAPRNFSPTSTAMFVAFRPGRLWLMDSISTNSLSSIHCRLMTRLLRRYGTTPPKLVAPMIRNSRKIWKTATSAGAVVAPAVVCNPGFAAVSLMALGLVSVEAVRHAGLGDAQRQPVRDIVLQGYVEHGCQLLLLLSNTFSALFCSPCICCASQSSGQTRELPVRRVASSKDSVMYGLDRTSRSEERRVGEE